MTPVRRFSRTIRLRLARKKVERTLEAATLRAFRQGWPRLYRSVRRLRKQDGEAWWEDWEREFEQALLAAFEQGAETFGGVEAAWYANAGRQVTFSSQAILQTAGVGERIKRIADDTRAWTRKAIQAWYTTDAGLPELVEVLRKEFSARRARLIAITETTFMASSTADYMMAQAGLDRWTWQTRKDDIVCDYCFIMHGTVWTRRDPAPPDASHPGCRCGKAPLIE